ncbi:MAG: DM13 domain-containing protein [Nodosilinea sp.]
MMIARLSLTVLMVAAALLAACNPSQTTSPETDAANVETASTVEEAPTTDSDSETTASATASSTTRQGVFASAEHETTGNVELISQDGQATLVFDENFATSNGPDLVVVLHRSADLITESTPPAYPINEEDYVVIAPLTATNGRQEYLVPAEIDLTAFESVAVWCQQFNATFGAAPL